MKLKIGVIGKEKGWKIILQQEGIFYDIITDFSTIKIDEYSVLIICKKLDNEEKKVVNNYIKSGGSVLIDSYSQFEPYKKIRRKYLISERNSIFSSIGIVDVFDDIYLPKNNMKALDTGLKIYTKKIGKGAIIFLPFDINKLLRNKQSKRKRFSDDRKELGSEIVAQVSKGKIRRIVRISLEYLHFQRDLPFVQKWYYPQYSKNIFIFRVDDDGCKPEEAKKMYEICQKHKINASWFLVADSLDRLKKSYSNFKSQELTLHCFKHQTYKNYNDNYSNLKKGKEILKKLQIETTGFVSPFGAWNESLAKAVDNLNFAYSSEFALDYDNLPFFPEGNNESYRTLQIPIHPISMGRLHRSHYSENEMKNYYKKVILRKLVLNEPIILYHHPHHKKLDVIDDIVEFINNQTGIWKTTMDGFRKWWKKRIQAKFKIEYADNELKILNENENNEVYLRVAADENNESIVKPASEISYDSIVWKNAPKFSFPDNIKRIRQWQWRDYLYDYESRKARRLL
ncbi:MAG: DUF2334 domain-containing protein [Candidatus Cloacimonadota bacterium]|nr:DUF2334 domain-containing protein [Candidatus Cloacimonadota bacterium]